ncbi:DsrE family protein [Alteromonas flava]|uniref:DsrE family protein n=1 Tax=Alteromonas flava TaxID=2048003 RepID=UPI000C2877C4|nr:DsrE family protein [Alteromonas flava]
MAKLLVIITHSPYSSSDSADAIDFALASTGYGHDCSILLCEHGVRYLSHSGDCKAFTLKDPRKQLNVLPFYDVEELYICAESLNAHQVMQTAAPDSAKIVAPDELALLTSQYDYIVSF